MLADFSAEASLLLRSKTFWLCFLFIISVPTGPSPRAVFVGMEGEGKEKDLTAFSIRDKKKGKKLCYEWA